jgi:small-conductance mechanosensitive channel
MQDIAETISWNWYLACGWIPLVFFSSYLIFKVIDRRGRSQKRKLPFKIIEHCQNPALLLILFLTCNLVLPLLKLPVSLSGFISHIISLCIIASVAWLLIQTTRVIEGFVLAKFDIGSQDNLAARKTHTQLGVINKIIVAIICVVSISAMLMTFEKVKLLGTSILASAGIAGIIIGFAAQRSLATIFAGLQIALTQPIRIDDVVIVEKEWGRIEEITLTYVVVRIWDLRRLVLPITYFTEKPFQNWTRITADILGSVFIYVDYTVPVQKIRDKFFEFVEQSKLWDGKVRVLQVTNTTEKTIELRALMSARNASEAWDLRCDMREKLVDFIQTKYPDSLPKVRGQLFKDASEVL